MCVCARRGPHGGCCRRPESAGDGTKDTRDKKKETLNRLPPLQRNTEVSLNTETYSECVPLLGDA